MRNNSKVNCNRRREVAVANLEKHAKTPHDTDVQEQLKGHHREIATLHARITAGAKYRKQLHKTPVNKA